MYPIPQVTYGRIMTSGLEPIVPSDEPGPAKVFCATCGHSEFVHANDDDRPCLRSLCACTGFVVGASPDTSAQVFPT